MTTPRPSAFYNPHLLSREELIAGFIARQPLLDLLLDDLRRGGGQHHLLVGVRGTGKTTLLLRLGLAIDDDPKLAKKAIALRFPEEQYNVSRPSDFWLNCADALVDALERRGETAEVRRLEADVVELDGLDDAVRAGRALAILQRWSARTRKLMVLLVDNLDLVLDRLPEHHWALRKVLGSDRHLVLVGASSTFLPESFEYGSAFYEFFNVHELGALDEAEARRVLTRLAEVTDTPDVTRVLVEEPSRLKAVLQLSGGTPRTLALLHGVLAQGQSTSAERDLQAMLDMVTPYYKARFEDLATQSQLIVDAVALHWHPISAAECAAKTGLEISLTSAQLTRLVRSGVLEKVPGEGSKLAFQVAERLFNIWYMMRASRRLRRQLFWVAASIQAIYGQEEVERQAAALLATAEGKAAASEPARLLAFAALVQDEAVRRRLESRAIAQLVLRGSAIETQIDLSGEDRHLRPVVDRARALQGVERSAEGIRWPRGLNPQRSVQCLVSDWRFATDRKARLVRSWTQSRPTRTAVERTLDLGDEAGWTDLKRAVARGDVPAADEVTSTADIDDIAALVSGEAKGTVLCLMAVGFVEKHETRAALWDHLCALEPTIGQGLMVGAYFATGWKEARPYVARAVPLLRPEWFANAGMWSLLVQRGYAGQIAALFVELECHERALPLYEALRAIASGKTAPLRHLAPELRTPTEQVLAGLLAPIDKDDVSVPTPAPNPPSEDARSLKAPRASRAAEPRPALKPTKAKRRARARRGSG